MSEASINKLWCILIILFFNLTVFTGCKVEDQDFIGNNNCHCDPPFSTSGNGYRLPGIYYHQQRVSPDGKKLAYTIGETTTSLNILDLKTLETSNYPLREILPDTSNWLSNAFCNYMIWCPYDASKIYLQCSIQLSKAQPLTACGYIYNFATRKGVRIYPKKFGALADFGVGNWLRGSKEGLDSLFSNEGPDNNAIYVIQQDSFYVQPPGYTTSLFQSNLTKDECIIEFNTPMKGYVNSSPFNNAQFMRNFEYASWSPDGKKLAMSTYGTFPTTTPGEEFVEVWILDASSVGQFPERIYRLNFQQLLCKYSLNGIHAEYITDSTLAVSMHKDGDAVSPLWEITDKGRIVRQLTK